MAQKNNEIMGFQFEPRIVRKDKPGDDSDSSWTTFDDSSEDEGSGENRCGKSIQYWCACGNCVPMPSEAESLCCSELEVHELPEYKGILI